MHVLSLIMSLASFLGKLSNANIYVTYISLVFSSWLCLCDDAKIPENLNMHYKKYASIGNNRVIEK